MYLCSTQIINTNLTQRIIIFLMICCGFIAKTEAQASRNYSIEITCKSGTYNSTHSILQFKWVKRSPSASIYYIYKKGKDRYDWGNPYRSVSGSDSSFNDTVLTGKAYEYMVEKSNGPDGYYTYGYIYAGHRLPAVSDRGMILLVIDSTHKTFLSNSIRTYINDLIGDGWQPLVRYVSPSNTVAQIKSVVKAAYSAYPTRLKSLVLIGDIAVPYSGDFSKYTSYFPPDGHVSIPGYGPSHEGAWPTDLYYGSMNNSLWKDSLVNNTLGVRPANRNVPNDGKFDVTVLPELLKLQIGRIDLSNMSLFKNDVPDTGNVERELLKRYFTKNHSFKHKAVTIKERCLIDDNFGVITGGSFNEDFAANAYRNVAPLISDTVFKNLDYTNTLNNNDYLWSFGFGAGTYLSCTNVGSTAGLASQNVKSVFNGFMGSFFGDWDTANNFLRAPLAAKGNALNSFWCGRPHWYFHHMGLGETIGYSALRSQNNYDSTWSAFFGQAVSLYWNYSIFPFEIHPSLMGDPTVRMQPVEPASQFVASQDSCNTGTFKLRWTGSSDTAVHSYYIYRAPHIDSTFTLIATTGNLYYKDNAPLSGTNVYMLRGLKLQVSGSGTYYNLSQGLFDTVSTTEFRLPIVNAGKDTAVCRNQMIRLGVKSLNSQFNSFAWSPGGFNRDTVSISVTSASNYVLTATDLSSGCIKRDTVVVSMKQSPVNEVVSYVNNPCSDTVTWSSNGANGINYEYNWTFNAGTPNDTIGFGLNAPGPVIYGNVGTFYGQVAIKDTASGCINVMRAPINLICGSLSVNWADLRCYQRGKNRVLEFLIPDKTQYPFVLLEGLDQEGNWIGLGRYNVAQSGLQVLELGDIKGFSAVRLKGINLGGDEEELDLCYWDSEHEISLYPVPVGNGFNVRFNNGRINKNSKVEVINALGQTIKEFVFDFETGVLYIDSSEMINGIYTIKISDNFGLYSMQFVK